MYHTSEQHDQIDRFYLSLDATGATSAVSVILKLRGETCDIDCLYCYEKRKEAPGGARIHADQVRRLAELFRGRPLAVELHGGEPLTAGRDHVRDVLEELAAQPRVVRVLLQTNGLLLDEQWLDLFDSVYPDLRIGISLDGDDRGNAWRVGYDGEPIYPRVAAALRLLAGRGRRAGVIAAVTPAVLGRAEAVLDHLAGFDAVDSISFVPCFDATVRRPTASSAQRLPASRLLQQAHMTDSSGPDWAIRPDEYAAFVLAATSHWIRSGHFVRIKLEPAVSTIRRLRGLDTGFCHFSDLKCDHVFTLYPDGRLGSCDELPWPQARLTMLPHTSDESDVGRAQQGSILLNKGKALMSRCTSCDYQSVCQGGCVATRLRYDHVGEQDAYCDYRMRMIDGIAALLACPDDPAGASCTTLRWRPRHPNTMRDVAAFLARWNDKSAPRSAVRLRTSAYGNINVTGLPGIQEADDLDPADPQWDDGIELGIRPLVRVLTREWGCVTYDSCQGHDYPGLDLPPAECRVGILPRDAQEYAVIATALCRAATAVAPALPTSVHIVVGRSELTCETRGRAVPVLDISLRPASDDDWPAYFDGLPQATSVLCSALLRERPLPGSGCACSTSPAPSEQREPA